MIDWESHSTEIFLNPRIPSSQRETLLSFLNETSLKGHIWLATSGTTGKIKCAALSKHAFLLSANAVNQHIGIENNDVWLHTLPDFHVGGLGIWARSHLSLARVVKLPKWDAGQFQKKAFSESATLTALVPAQVYDLVQCGLQAPSSLRAVIVGGGAIVKPLYDQALSLGWKLLPSYGMTECASQVATVKPGDFDSYQLLSHIQGKFDDNQTLWIRSDSLLTIYAISNGSGIEMVDPKVSGWFQTGDKGFFQNGKLRITGREGDFIKINGENVNLHHLQKVAETVMEELQLNQKVLIHPIPHQRSGFRIHLLMEGNGNTYDLIRLFNLKVMPYERIQKVHCLSQFPRTALGKIQREKIAIGLD
jgi:o-succinylbenzoate---CoA ligase